MIKDTSITESERLDHFRAANEYYLNLFFGFHNYTLYKLPGNLIFISRITDLQDFIKAQTADLIDFDEALVKRWLKQITVWPDHCTIVEIRGIGRY